MSLVVVVGRSGRRSVLSMMRFGFIEGVSGRKEAVLNSADIHEFPISAFKPLAWAANLAPQRRLW
jgi:hypothetical protein